MPHLQALLRSRNIDVSTLAPLPRIGEHQMFSLTTHGLRAVALWKQLRALTPASGHYPLILGEPGEMNEQFESAAGETGTVDSLLKSASLINIPDELRKKRELDPEFYENLDEGVWPSQIPAPSTHFQIPTNIRTGKPHERCVLALLPTTDPTSVLAYLHYGGWNDCPYPDVHVAYARHWNARHGAEIIGASRDVVEMIVSRPPTTREAALELAREQYAYCYDIVDQGCGTISALAATLLNSPSWYFWWD